MCGEPRTGHRTKVPGHILGSQRGGEPERIPGDRRGPATSSVVRACHPLSRPHERTDIFKEWLGAFRQVGGAGRPVVHLDVDVVVVVHIPRAVNAIVPYSLKIGGQVAGPGGGDQQIAAELVVKFLQTRIGSTRAITFKAFRSGQIDWSGISSQRQIDPTEQ